MFDFSKLRKYIYFPSMADRRKDPRIIYVIERWGLNWKGGEDVQEVMEGNTELYQLPRCQPYSDELWQACQEWSARREQLEKDFKTLMEKGVSDG